MSIEKFSVFISKTPLFYILFFCLISCSSPQLQSDKTNSTSIRITEAGNSSDDAKQRAFKRAIEHRVGVLIVGERIVENQEINQKILTYSSGFIRDYKLINSQIKDGKYIDTYDIWVEDSKIAEGLLTIKNINFSIEGKKIIAIIKNKDSQNEDATALISHLLDGWPKKAILVSYDSRNITYDIDRNILLNLNGVSLTWAPGFEQSLREALDRLSVKPSINTPSYILSWNQDYSSIEYIWSNRNGNTSISKRYHNDGPGIFSAFKDKRYYISDGFIRQKISENFNKLMYIKIELKNQESILDHYCIFIADMTTVTYDQPYRLELPNVNKKIANIPLNINRSTLEKLTNVEISMASPTCK
jgi:hypothetical protein